MDGNMESVSGGVGNIPNSFTVGLNLPAQRLDVVLEKVAAPTCKNVPVLVGKNVRVMAAVLFRPRCKLWSCPSCAKTNADLWQMRGQLGAQALLDAGHQLVLVTVTAHERHSVKRAVEVLPDGWNKLRNRWQRATSSPQYILIPEVGKRGHFHLHFITTGGMGTRWWKDNARSSGFGYSNDESEGNLSSAKASYYCGKYLAKQLNNNIWRKGFHRVRTSQNWPKIPPLARDEDWRFEVLDKMVALRDIARELSDDGYAVRIADHRSAWSLIETGDTEGTFSL
jgi:hypothetical protein